MHLWSLGVEEQFGPEAMFTGLNEEQKKKLGGLFSDKGRLNFRNQEELDAYEGEYVDLTPEQEAANRKRDERLFQIKEQEGKKLYPSLYDDKKMNSFFDRQNLERSTRQEDEERAALQQRQQSQQNILARGDKEIGVMERDNLRIANRNEDVNPNYAGLSQDEINRQNAQNRATSQKAGAVTAIANLTEEQKAAMRRKMEQFEAQESPNDDDDNMNQ